MTARYRFVNFAPNPAFTRGLPVAALIERGRDVSVAVAPKLPDVGCLGGVRMAAALRIAIEDLARVTSFDALPRCFGPHVSLGEPRSLPMSIEDPAEWVRTVALRVSTGQELVALAQNEDAPTEPRPLQRAAAGYAFFVANKVQEYVRKGYNPRDEASFLPEEATFSMGTVTHWVAGKSELLLMEPVALQRENSDRDIAEISKRFAMYDNIRSESWPESVPRPRLIAYILSGGRREERVRAQGLLEPWSDEVVDVSIRAEKRGFVSSITAVGSQLFS